MSKQTLKGIMSEMERRVEENEPVSPVQWVESAMRIFALKGNEDNLLAEMEATMAEAEALAISNGDTSAKAKVVSKTMIDYKKYLILKAYIKRIEEFARLAKHRSRIIEY